MNTPEDLTDEEINALVDEGRTPSRSFVDGVRPNDALNAPSAVSLLVPHTADPANRFADQMRTFDNMRRTNLEYYRSAR